MVEQLTRVEPKIDQASRADGKHAERLAGDSLTNPYIQADTIRRLTGERSTAQRTVDTQFGGLQITDNKSEGKPGAGAERTGGIAPPAAPGERVVKGDKGQVVHFDGANRINEIDYPNGMKVKLQRDTSGDITRADISGAGAGLDGSVVKKGDQYERFDTKGKATGQIVTKVEINNDGSAVVSGKQFGFSGKQIVATDGKVTTKLDG
ncbi:hypothetical protein BH10CYA1_BH10CYA1_04750 [soil metagenome]